MPGLVPDIHAFNRIERKKTWMAGTSSAKTRFALLPGHDEFSHPLHGHRNLRAVLDGLVDHAIALGEFQEQIELVLRRVGIDVETQTNFGKTDRRLLVDAERAAEIEIALGGHEPRLQRHLIT